MSRARLQPSQTLSAIITTESLRRFRDAERFMPFCKQCGNYGKNYACPPVPFEINELLARYAHAEVYAHIFKLGGETHELTAARRYCDDLILAAETLNNGSMGFLSGACVYCDSCCRAEAIPCRFPDKSKLSLDVLSLDVTALLLELFDYSLTWKSDRLCFVTLLLFDKT